MKYLIMSINLQIYSRTSKIIRVGQRICGYYSFLSIQNEPLHCLSDCHASEFWNPVERRVIEVIQTSINVVGAADIPIAKVV